MPLRRCAEQMGRTASPFAAVSLCVSAGSIFGTEAFFYNLCSFCVRRSSRSLVVPALARALYYESRRACAKMSLKWQEPLPLSDCSSLCLVLCLLWLGYFYFYSVSYVLPLR